jgi:hypothetical protein
MKKLFVAYLCVIGANLIFFPHQVYAGENKRRELLFSDSRPTISADCPMT